MKADEDHLLIFEGASAGRYPQRSRPSEQRHKNRQMASALWVAEIQAKGHKAFGFVAWLGGQLRWLRVLLARPLLRIRYGFPQRPLCDLISGSQGNRFRGMSWGLLWRKPDARDWMWVVPTTDICSLIPMVS
ncbi:MAG: hypothetical protein WAL87_10235 [Chthoniobacterales bacterium]